MRIKKKLELKDIETIMAVETVKFNAQIIVETAKLAFMFSDFVFKIELIRLGFLSNNKKMLYLNSQPAISS